MVYFYNKNSESKLNTHLQDCEAVSPNFSYGMSTSWSFKRSSPFNREEMEEKKFEKKK